MTTLPAAVVETHTAVLFFVDDRVYKLKKAVDLGFLDHRTARRAASPASRRWRSTAAWRPTCTWACST